MRTGFPAAVDLPAEARAEQGGQLTTTFSYTGGVSLPALPPDFTFPRLGGRRQDIDFAFEAKRAAMGSYIVRRWAWDVAVQHDFHERRFAEKPFFEIRRGEERLGTLSFHMLSDHVRYGEFNLFPVYQGRGTGSAISFRSGRATLSSWGRSGRSR